MILVRLMNNGMPNPSSGRHADEAGRAGVRWMTAALALALALSGMAADVAVRPGRPQSSANPGQGASVATNTTPVLAKSSDQLGSGDKLQFVIEEDPATAGGTKGPTELVVGPGGEVNFPVSRDADQFISVNVRDKTLAKIKDELKSKLDADFYQNATIQLRIKEQAQKRGEILFTGQVRASVLPILPGESISLFEAMVKVGYTEFANLKKVRLHRVNPTTGKTETTIYDVDAMIKGDHSKDVHLQDGDHVEVKEKTIVGF